MFFFIICRVWDLLSFLILLLLVRVVKKQHQLIKWFYLFFLYCLGGDEVVVKPTFNSVDIKPEPMDRSSPGPLKMARKATASVKSEINGYGSPQNATDESESLGLRGGAGAGKRKPRATAAATKDKRAKTVAAAAAAAAAAATVSATPASSTGGSSSEGEASESENDVNNGGGGRTKKGGAVAALKESCGKSGAGGAGRGSLAGRQRNSDSSSSSKEGQPVRKGRAGGGVSGSTGGAATAAPGNSSPSGPNAKPGSGNPFNKPPVPVLKKSGESFLQVSRIHPSIRLDMITIVISGISFRVHRMLPVGKSRPVWPSAANAVSLLINDAGTNSKAMPTSFAASTLSGGYDTPSRASWPSLAFPIR
jgi:hypothetical protein